MTSEVIARLKSLGYVADNADSQVIFFLANKVASTIANECNTSGVPDGLHLVAIDMVVGEFLMGVKVMAPEKLATLDLTAAVKQIQEGDTNVSFAVGSGSSTPEQRLDALIEHLATYGRAQFSAYRRIKW